MHVCQKVESKIRKLLPGLNQSNAAGAGSPTTRRGPKVSPICRAYMWYRMGKTRTRHAKKMIVIAAPLMQYRSVFFKPGI